MLGLKYSVRGLVPIADGNDIVATINSYTLWRLVTQDSQDEQGGDLFTFEAWVNTEADKTTLFNDLKPFVDIHGGSIDWHECTHDELVSRPCIISETYAG